MRAERLAMAAATCPVVGEPCVWLADAARRRGDRQPPASGPGSPSGGCSALGTSWDKRLRFDEWLALARIARGADR